MGTRRRYSASIYTRQNNSTTGAIVRKRNKGIRENNRTTIMGQWENRLGIIKEQWGDNNRSAIVYVAQWENLERWYDTGKERR